MKCSLKPGRAFNRTLWRKLDDAWSDYHHVPRTWYQRHVMRLATAAVSGFVVCASAATGAYAYTSPDVTEGNILYPIKQTLEQVEEKTKHTPEAKAQFYLKQLSRREAEKKTLEHRQERTERLEAQINQIEVKLEATEHELTTSTLVNNTELREKMYNRLEKRKNRLEKQKKKLDERLLKLNLQAHILVTSSSTNLEPESENKESTEIGASFSVSVEKRRDTSNATRRAERLKRLEQHPERLEEGSQQFDTVSASTTETIQEGGGTEASRPGKDNFRQRLERRRDQIIQNKLIHLIPQPRGR